MPTLWQSYSKCGKHGHIMAIMLEIQQTLKFKRTQIEANVHYNKRQTWKHYGNHNQNMATVRQSSSKCGKHAQSEAIIIKTWLIGHIKTQNVVNMVTVQIGGECGHLGSSYPVHQFLQS